MWIRHLFICSCSEKGVEKVKTGTKELDEAPTCTVAMTFAKLYAGLSILFISGCQAV